MLKVIYSNKMTELAKRLAILQASQPLPPLLTETVIVESNQLARWLSLFLANQHGIASNINFPYCSAFIWTLFTSLLRDVPDTSPFSKDAMTWRLFALLSTCHQQKSDFAQINAYLGAHDDSLKRYALARRIADNFDRYLLYRPDWIKAWEEDAPHWQAKLWQKMVADNLNHTHRANLLFQLCTYLKDADERPARLPHRITIFGVSSLPPIYLQVFNLLARFCDVYIFFLSPSEEYWADLVTPKQHSKQRMTAQQEDDYLTIGHPLLASLGKQGQEFFDQLADYAPQQETFYIPPVEDKLLGYVQHDIFSLHDDTSFKRQITKEDDSISIHVCHSPMREVEVLHDSLLALFERRPSLSPSDIVVMMPDIDRYVSAINAVFACTPLKQRIPYSIADGRESRQGQISVAFNSLLALPQSRFEVDSVVALLECAAIRQRFSLTEDKCTLIKRWLQETQIRWGISAEDKAKLGLPPTAENTWRAGLDRLLLGYAMLPGDEPCAQQLFAGKLAFAGINGEQAETMAQLCAFIDLLDEYRQRLNADLKSGDWQKMLYRMLDDFFAITPENNQQQPEILSIRQALDYMVETTTLADFNHAISIDVVKDWLNDHISHAKAKADRRFMGYGVTFCRMLPMRSIPFEVVCLIGMDYDSYPRRQPSLSFDVLQTDIRKGDRSPRDDDKYLFLESILSAQSYLYISYVGASIEDNSKIPPSVLVSDLCDVLRQRFETEEKGDIWQACLTEHPLQAFSPRYFDGRSAHLFSYAQDQCPPLNKKDDSALWFDSPLLEADESWKKVSLHQLSQFFHHPARYLCQQRLGLYLPKDDVALEGREPFDLDGLERWRLHRQLVHYGLEAKISGDTLALVKAQGILPQGRVGEYVFKEEAEKVTDFMDTWSDDYPRSDAKLLPLPFKLSINDFTFYGELAGLSHQGLFTWRVSNASGGSVLEAWLRHLVLSALKPEGVNVASRCIFWDKDYTWRYVDDNPEAILADLLNLYWQGLHQPLALFSKTSFAFFKATPNARINDTNVAWNGLPMQNITGEKDDNYHQRIYTLSPLDENFEEFNEVAHAVYTPIEAHLAKGSKL